MLSKRARAKYLSTPLAVALAELRTALEKSYRSTVYCASVLYQQGGTLCANYYCGHRWCLVCNRIRTARAIDKYVPALRDWGDRFFVTLTIPNVSDEELAAAMDKMLASVPRIARAIRRTDRLAFRALRKLECTYNMERNDFHPHLHFIVDGAPAAHALVDRWLATHPNAVRAAQDIRVCDEGQLREALKYFAKITSKVGRHRTITDISALDVIFRAMRGRRVYQPMGFKAASEPPDADDSVVALTAATEAPTVARNTRDWEWSHALTDWVDFATGELLSGYIPSARMRGLVEPLCAKIERKSVEIEGSNDREMRPKLATLLRELDPTPRFEGVNRLMLGTDITADPSSGTRASYRFARDSERRGNSVDADISRTTSISIRPSGQRAAWLQRS